MRWLTLSLLALPLSAALAQVKDDDVLKLVYDKAYRVPKGFYEDPALTKSDRSLYYHQEGWFADDKARAKKIVEDFLAKPSAIAVKKIEEETESDLSYDFRAGTIVFRVHKPGYFAWTGKRVGEVNQKLKPGKEAELGTFKGKGLDAKAVKHLAEYDWLIENYNMGGAKVLSSEGKEADGKLIHTLTTTQVTFGDFGLKDEIRVVEVTYTVDKKDGKTTKKVEEAKKLTGRGR